MGQEVGLSAGGTTGRAHDPSARYVEVDNERAGPMTNVLELAVLDLARSKRQARRGSLQGLDTSHFVGAHGMLAPFCPRPSLSIDRTDIGNFLLPIHLLCCCGS